MIYVRGKGATIETLGGERYIDGLAGLWNVNVGHGRAELAEAAAAQMKELAYFSAYTGSSNLPAVQLAEKLIGLAYDNMQGVFFTCGGAESNESAFKTARFYWKAKGKPDKFKVIARQNAYHGVTQQAMSATGMAAYWKMFEPRVPGFVHIPTCYPYRQQDAKPGESAGQTAARLLDEAITREGQDTVAAFIAEPIHGGGGVLVPDDDYFRLVREVCTKREVLFIGDEVITGFCRTGRWFALSHWNVKPDIMSFAKGVTSGYLPLGGVVVSGEVAAPFFDEPGGPMLRHGATYAGHPSVCAAALCVLDIYERESIIPRGRELEGVLTDALAPLADHPAVSEVRSGCGLLAAVALEDPAAVPKVAAGAREAGVLLRPLLGALAVSPPLIVEREHLEEIADGYRAGLDRV
jgi:putrescine---pyruvate transaminase